MNLIASPPEAFDPAVNCRPKTHANSRTNLLIFAWLIGLVGAALRLIPTAGFQGVGFDESLYRRYVVLLDGGENIVSVTNQDNSRTGYRLRLGGTGLAIYPDLADFFVASQGKENAMCELPPTRFLYIYSSWLWKRLEFGSQGPVAPGSPGWAQTDPALVSLHRIAAIFSVLTLALAGIAAWRMSGPQTGVCVLALIAFAPSALHLGQHALIDGFFVFWAMLSLWLVWENLQRPNHLGLLAALTTGLAFMVMTKENSFFVYCGLMGLVLSNRWLKFGTVTPRLLVALFLGPLFGVLILMTLAGGAENFIEVYRLLVARASNLEYARLTGDGPWYRYFVDYMVLSPIVLGLAIAALFTSVKGNRALMFMVTFTTVTYLIMCNIRYGMNLRYATIWDLPIRMLAVAQITLLAQLFNQRRALVMTLLIAGISLIELRQYYLFSVKAGMYEMTTATLLRAVNILKPGTPL